MTREECERVLLRAEKSQIQPSTGTIAAALRATLDREAKARDAALAKARDAALAKARDAALEEAARECEFVDAEEDLGSKGGAAVRCAAAIRALKSPGAR